MEPVASAPVAVALARAATLSAVTSPLKSVTPRTSLTAWAPAVPVAREETLDESAPVRTSEPSAGKTKPSATPVAAGPGAVASAATETGWPGTRIESPCAPAETIAGSEGALAPVAAAASDPAIRSSASNRGYTRLHYPDLARRCGALVENENRFQLFSPAWQASSHSPTASARPRRDSPSCARWPSRRAASPSPSCTIARGGSSRGSGSRRPTGRSSCSAPTAASTPCSARGGRRTSAAVPSTTTTSSARAAAASRRPSCAQRRRRPSSSARHGFSPAAHELDIYGTCRRCA